MAQLQKWKTFTLVPKLIHFFNRTLAWHGKLRAVGELYRIFFNSFKSIVQEDWKGIETNEKKNTLYLTEPEHQTILYLSRTTMEHKRFRYYSSSWSVNHLLLKTSTSLSGFIKLFAQQGVYVHILYKSFYSCRYPWRRAMLEENATSLT